MASIQCVVVIFAGLLAIVCSRVESFGINQHANVNYLKIRSVACVEKFDVLMTAKATRRRDFLQKAAPLTVFLVLLGTTPSPAMAKSYSANARNMERMNAGDFSGGSVYDNNPSSRSARKRRAMVGCKIASSRQAAAEALGVKNLSEKDCNIAVMDTDDPAFMLEAMSKLECPSCPYGVNPNKNF